VSLAHPATPKLTNLIVANTIFLLPFVMPEARQQTTFENVSYTVEPKVYIVVSGAKPYVRAYVMVGYEFHSQKSKMFYGNYADTTGEALDKLLKVTMNLVSKVKHRVVSASRFAIDDVGGYYAGNPRMSPEQVDEDRWWGSSKGNSPVFSCKPNFTNRMPTPETDDETAHPIGNDNGGVNIHGTANANGGSASGNGMKISGLNGSFDDIASGSDTA